MIKLLIKIRRTFYQKLASPLIIEACTIFRRYREMTLKKATFKVLKRDDTIFALKRRIALRKRQRDG